MYACKKMLLEVRKLKNRKQVLKDFVNYGQRNEKWAHIRWTDEQFCDGTKHCENAIDEPDGCRMMIVTGSDGRDGIYRTERPTPDNRNPYVQEGGRGNIIFRKGDGWVLGDGTSDDATVVYKSEKRTTKT